MALTERVTGTSVFLFGWADSPQRRGLAKRRKEIGWFKKVLDMSTIQPDVGPQPTRKYGVTGNLKKNLQLQNIEWDKFLMDSICFCCNNQHYFLKKKQCNKIILFNR